jgi:hypothetical protein
MPPALRARSAALFVLLAGAADPVEVALVLVDPVAAAPVGVVDAEVVVVTGALKGVEVELGYWLAYPQKICCWPW